jgi:hypothetical protein
LNAGKRQKLNAVRRFIICTSPNIIRVINCRRLVGHVDEIETDVLKPGLMILKWILEQQCGIVSSIS